MGFAYRIGNQQALHYVTLTVEQWVNVFTRPAYVDVLLGSLRHCQEKKGPDIYARVVMSNHLHAILACREGFELSNALRDMKKFTATAIAEAIAENPRESRREWLLWLLRPRVTHRVSRLCASGRKATIPKKSGRKSSFDKKWITST